MVINVLGKTFVVNLTPKQFSNTTEDSVLSVFLPQRKYNQLHKLFTEHLPKDRNTWLEFGWNLENAILHVSGSSKDIFYREAIDVEFNKKEEIFIKKEIEIISK